MNESLLLPMICASIFFLWSAHSNLALTSHLKPHPHGALTLTSPGFLTHLTCDALSPLLSGARIVKFWPEG